MVVDISNQSCGAARFSAAPAPQKYDDEDDRKNKILLIKYRIAEPAFLAGAGAETS